MIEDSFIHPDNLAPTLGDIQAGRPANPEWVAWLEDQNRQLTNELADALDEVDRLRRLFIAVEGITQVALPD